MMVVRGGEACFSIGAPGVVPGWAFWAKAAVAAKTTRTLAPLPNVISVSFAKSIYSGLSLGQESMGEMAYFTWNKIVLPDMA